MLASTASILLAVSDSGWSAIGTCVGVGVVAVAAGVAFFQLRLGQRLRDEQAQPYVVIYAEHNEAHPHFVDLIVKNFGATAAKDITITIDPPLKRSAGTETEDIKGPGLIRTLVPGQEWRTFWDSTIDRGELDMPSQYTASIQFSDSRGKTLGPYIFNLDWGQIMERGWLNTYGMHELTEAVREIRDVFRHRGDMRYLHVLAYSGEEHDRRQLDRAKECRREREQAQQPESPEDSSD